MATKQDEIKVVVGAGVFNNNPGWGFKRKKMNLTY